MALSPEDGKAYSYHKASLSEDQLTTDRQRERRSRILDSAVDVARNGGFTRVHMRDVADYAQVSLGTLYHYFPSKVHLLVMALERELLRFDDLLTDGLPHAADPCTKLRAAVWGLINGMEESDPPKATTCCWLGRQIGTDHRGRVVEHRGDDLAGLAADHP